MIGLWRFTPPPRTIATNPALFEVQELRAQKEGVSAALSIHPPIAGPVRVEIGNLLLDGKPFEPIGISVDLDKPSYGIGPFTREARRASDGIYHADGFVLPLDGFWIVRVTILVSDFRSVTLMDVFDSVRHRDELDAGFQCRKQHLRHPARKENSTLQSGESSARHA